MNCEYYRNIIAIGTLTLFLTTFPVFAEPPMRESSEYETAGTRFYSESELRGLIDELAEAAVSEIETVAGEAAKAAAMAGLEKQAAQLAEIVRLEKQNGELKKSGVKNLVIAGLSCFVAGAALSGGLILFAGR
ncbi:MAG: ABC transporter permease [Spirochaetaceae bacterium]|jgi:hypothetical protein|nr:ABC transporter permease [Spirochaetaceae bacterium]